MSRLRFHLLHIAIVVVIDHTSVEKYFDFKKFRVNTSCIVG